MSKLKRSLGVIIFRTIAGAFFGSCPSLSPCVPLFDSTLLHISSVWDLVRDHGLEKGQVPMYDNSQRIPNFPIVREQML